MKKIGLSFFLGFLFLCHSSFDTYLPSRLQTETYSKEQIENFIREVYTDAAESLFFKPNSTRLKLTTDFLQRVRVVKNAQYKTTKLPSLSSVSLINDYNPSLTRETVFDPKTFNPLKYDFEMFSKSRLIIKVDDTDYAIIIEPRRY
ncbi:MAG: hypothetical protein JST78_06665 [Bacteroidetes bacterium]|nr:hypothetical protein [Bacteroidota bacterium]